MAVLDGAVVLVADLAFPCAVHAHASVDQVADAAALLVPALAAQVGGQGDRPADLGAVDEASSQCVSQPELLRSPNFIGTIDSFIYRFFIGAIYVDRTNRAPTSRDTWRDVPGSTFAVRHVQGSVPARMV
jgi:hypothetical protein